MSEPYTPQTDDVRAKFADWYSIYDYRDIAEGWFDRWLGQVKAAARREGQAEAWPEEEWSAAYWAVFEDGTRTLRLIGTEGDRDHAEDTRNDCSRDDPDTRFFLVRRPVAAWIPADENADEQANQ